MTHIRSTIVAALLVFGGAAIASAQEPTPPAPQTATPQAQQVHRGPHARHARRAHGLVRNVRHQLFKGITLSDAEKANLKSVHAKYAPRMKAQRAQIKQLLESERNDVRGALTPADQAKFDANVKQLRERAAMRGRKGWKKRGSASEAH